MYELTMTESIEMRNYSNLKVFPSYANDGPFTFEIVALHGEETVTVLLQSFTV